MKTQFQRSAKLFALLLLITLTNGTLTSCNDDDERPQLGTLTVGAKARTIDYGAVLRDKVGQRSSVTGEKIYFHIIKMAGPNDVGFSMDVVSSGMELESGEYTYQQRAYRYQSSPGDVWFCSVIVPESSYDDLTEGTVTVTRNGDSYTFQGTAVLNGESIAFSFSGKVQLI